MSDKQPMQADGGNEAAEHADGTNSLPNRDAEGGGESGGGAYKNNDQIGGKGHDGGQTTIDYHGGANPNATTGGSDPD